MEAPHTPYDFKELLVEISVRKCMGDSMSEAVSPKNLIAMSMLDSGCLRDLGTSLYSGPDLFTSLRHDMSGSSREKWIEAQLMSLLRDEALKNEIDRLLNEDLKTAGKQDLITMGAQLANKARAIASYRIRNTISLMPQPSNSMGAEDTGTFRVILRSLVGGHGGSRKESLLYLNYNTSFPLFQIILRDATQLSTIPPIDLDQQTPPKKETSPDIGSEMASQESNIRYSRQSQQRSSESSYRERNSLSPLGPQDIPDQQERAKPRNSNARGYTIDDGPWLYYLGHKGQARSGNYIEIKDEDSYLKMIEGIREVSRKDISNYYCVVLFHSMDKKASDRWSLVRNEEADAERQFQKACRRGEISGVSGAVNDDDEVEDEIGEPYMQWMAKNIAYQKGEQGSSRKGGN